MQDFVLIWRLYVVWGSRWHAVVLPVHFCGELHIKNAYLIYLSFFLRKLLLEALHLGVGLSETAITTGTGHLPQFSALLILAWVIVVTINVGTTLGIAGRLLYIERSMSFGQTWTSNAGPSSSRYSAPIFTMIESGAIFTTSTVVLLVLYAVGSPLLQTAVNIATQLAVSSSESSRAFCISC